MTPSLEVAVDPRLAFGIGASATRFDNAQWSLGGGATAAERSPMSGPVTFTLNGDAGGTTTSYRVSYLTADAIPAIELSLGRVAVFGGGHLAAATISQPQQAPVPAGPFDNPVTGRSSVSLSRATIGPLVGANLRLEGNGGEPIVLGYREERATIAGVAATDRQGSVSVHTGALSLAAAAGVRREGGAASSFGSGSASIDVGGRVALELSAGSYLANRLLGTPGGRSLSVGISLRGASHELRLPQPTGVGAPTAGTTRLSLRADDVARVEVAGDFTNWKPVPASRAANGVWFVDLRIPPGQYRYAFRVDGKEWRVPEGAAAVDDDFGGKSAWLTINASPPGTTVRH